MASNSTLFQPSPSNPSMSIIENHTEVISLSSVQPDLFTNARPQWHPPGSRGIYGGAVLAQSLAAAIKTVPADFHVHSLHCNFVFSGDQHLPFLFYVDRIRDGNSFATRTVRVNQKEKCILTTTASFVRANNRGKQMVQHSVELPKDLRKPVDEELDEPEEESDMSQDLVIPFITHHEKILNRHNDNINHKKIHNWIKAKGKISEAGGRQAHAIALAYISDFFFLGTITALHDVQTLHNLYREEESTNEATGLQLETKKPVKKRHEVGMMVSLDHSIYFHEPLDFKADEWIFTEMSTPWSGNGRGIVSQHMFNANGTMIATCYQEGIVRLKDVSDCSPHPTPKL